jgi:hypothetical protein
MLPENKHAPISGLPSRQIPITTTAQSSFRRAWRFWGVVIVVSAFWAVVPGVYEYLTLRGWVNVGAARVVLGLSWFAAVSGVAWGAFMSSDVTKKKKALALLTAAIVLGCLFLGLDLYVSNHPNAGIPPQNIPKAAEIAAELFKLLPGLSVPRPAEHPTDENARLALLILRVELHERAAFEELEQLVTATKDSEVRQAGKDALSREIADLDMEYLPYHVSEWGISEPPNDRERAEIAQLHLDIRSIRTTNAEHFGTDTLEHLIQAISQDNVKRFRDLVPALVDLVLTHEDSRIASLACRALEYLTGQFSPHTFAPLHVTVVRAWWHDQQLRYEAKDNPQAAVF